MANLFQALATRLKRQNRAPATDCAFAAAAAVLTTASGKPVLGVNPAGQLVGADEATPLAGQTAVAQKTLTIVAGTPNTITWAIDPGQALQLAKVTMSSAATLGFTGTVTPGLQCYLVVTQNGSNTLTFPGTTIQNTQPTSAGVYRCHIVAIDATHFNVTWSAAQS